jgi:signal transduction histidine kinase
MEALNSKGSLRNFDTVAKRLDGTLFPVRLSCTLKEEEKSSTGNITTFFRDVSVLKIEEELKMIRELSRRVLADRETERKEIARDIHDQLGQTLSGLKIDLNWLLDNLHDTSIEVREKILELRGLTEDLISEVQSLVTRLRPAVLDRIGLGAALEWLLEDLEKHLGIRYEIMGDLEAISIDEETETAVFRIIQESLTNVARHSGASYVKLKIEQAETSCIFEIIDNGRGMSKDQYDLTASMGILGMVERARGIGGELSVESTRGQGTSIRLKLPVLQKNG